LTNKNIHIISFDIPYPANYGGVILVYHHLRWLFKKGYKITFHCFQYGNRIPARELEELCEEVHYYRRKNSLLSQFSNKPFIAVSRADSQLFRNLQKDNAPIFFEGLHTCAFIGQEAFKDRLKIVRMHNIEWQYYSALADLETNFIKKKFFQIESKKLKSYEVEVCKNANHIICLSQNDKAYYQMINPNTHLIFPFHANDEITTKKGSGNTILFHGNLSVSDNHQAALFIVNEIASSIDFPFVIAGMNPKEELKKAIAQHNNVLLVDSPNQFQMEDILQKAHIQVLWTYQSAGMKLKLLNTLYQGRYCIANDLMVQNTGLEDLCHIANNAKEVIHKIQILLKKGDFNESEIQKRQEILSKEFSNQANIDKTIKILHLT